MKKKKILRALLFVLTFATLAFIWIHSMMPESASSEESRGVLEFLKPFLELFFGKGNVTVHLVRKLAHLAEYAAFGFELALIFNMYVGGFWKRIRAGLNTALIVAFIDETIQIFSGRGPQISDMWIDLAGAAIGTLCALVILLLVGRKKEE